MLFRAIKKQRPGHSYRSFSEGSNRSYHKLIGSQDSVDGSSHHRRTRSEFQPSTVDHFMDRQEFSRSTSFNKLGSGLAPGFTGNGSRQVGSNAYQGWNGTGSNLRRR